MKEEEVIEANMMPSTAAPDAGDVVDPPPQQPSPYEMLLRQSKKMGGVATKTYENVKTVLNREVPLPSRDDFLASLSFKPHAETKLGGEAVKGHEKVATLRQRVRKSHQVLGYVRTVFPMKLFPTTVVLDRSKLTIVRRDFFWTSNVISVRIEDILNVSCGVGPLFGSITVSSRVMNSIDHFEVSFLWRSDATHIKNMIQGYMIAKHDGIDTEHLTQEEMVETIYELGHDSDTR